MEEDALYCSKMVRHAAVGAMIGGPAAAAIAWFALQATGYGLRPTVAQGGGLILLILGVVALLLGVWIGSTLSCCFIGRTSTEERCYGGGLGCAIYLAGGVLGALLGPVLVPRAMHPLAWYLIGGTVLGGVALVFTVLCPSRRAALSEGSTAPSEPSQAPRS